jgi:trehalose 2-sulfotransferase
MKRRFMIESSSAFEGTRACIIAATPRTGSHHLAELLWTTDLCGRPSEYVRREDKAIWGGLHGCKTFEQYLDFYLIRGWSSNRVFGAKLMWDQLARLARDLSGDCHLSDREIANFMDSAFDKCKYIFLIRRNVVRQAISYFRALNTGQWHRASNEVAVGQGAETFDFDKIEALRSEIERSLRRWKAYFAHTGVEHMTIFYEELVSDRKSCINSILDFMNIPGRVLGELGPGHLLRQSDETTEEWLSRYDAIVQSRRPGLSRNAAD